MFIKYNYALYMCYFYENLIKLTLYPRHRKTKSLIRFKYLSSDNMGDSFTDSLTQYLAFKQLKFCYMDE